MSEGHFIGRLTAHFGMVSDEGLIGLTIIAREPPMIDMDDLVKLNIYVRLDDTWAWVAPGPERQPVVVAPQPPLAAARTRNMVHRLSRLEEKVHSLCGDIGDQREVLDSMACDFSRLTTWTVTSLSLMMDRSGVRYTSYADTRIPYQRCRVRQRTGEANTSAAPLDEDQPDP
ncbi:hypothetical protein Tco_1230430 [Tanacetum coccineum]